LIKNSEVWVKKTLRVSTSFMGGINVRDKEN